MLDNPGNSRWQVASGHSDTTRSAEAILEAGGNAADAAVAGALAACVAEPLLATLGGGGYALATTGNGSPKVLDFFTQTPITRLADGLDFFPITGDFGPDTQEFHIGLGSMATPGVIAGLFELNRRLGRMPMTEVAAPAIDLARSGVLINPVQAYTLRILEPIVRASPGSARVFGLDALDQPLLEAGELLSNPDYGDYLETLVGQGPDFFYRGGAAAGVARDCLAGGGHLRLEDFAGYQACWRDALDWTYRDCRLYSNPPPAFGGMLVSLATTALEGLLSVGTDFGSLAHIQALVEAFQRTEQARVRLERPELFSCSRTLLASYRNLVPPPPVATRGTTHISIRDRAGDLVAMTLSNGEGAGYVIPDTGIMMNNMLGEEDVNRAGFHQWPENRRMASMMAPVLIELAGQRIVMGSGGSNRIRTALAQVISNLVDFQMAPDEAVMAPRLHLEGERMAFEQLPGGYGADALAWLQGQWSDHRAWPEANMYFGGVHLAGASEAFGDPRRAGVASSG